MFLQCAPCWRLIILDYENTNSPSSWPQIVSLWWLWWLIWTFVLNAFPSSLRTLPPTLCFSNLFICKYLISNVPQLPRVTIAVFFSVSLLCEKFLCVKVHELDPLKVWNFYKQECTWIHFKNKIITMKVSLKNIDHLSTLTFLTARNIWIYKQETE